MELTYATIAVLASMIFVLAGMVGYLYWQQTRILQHLGSLASVVSTHFQPQPEPEPEVHHEEEEEDDRVSVVEEKVEHIEGPPEPKVEQTPTATSASEDDVDDLQSKTTTELKQLLSQKGIPYGKRDSKPVLIQLLKATS